ncbi:hypothetical protein VaNZ11_001638 [Volvox africanus]|uniref:Uncharacterized protein n=1 Tax=Volvox africanus TaxID=51714 RepID=A0ABQ5RQW0_9CHLO|nr:hypothetical protein VaNZ11_001638 [Volvox africanus]
MTAQLTACNAADSLLYSFTPPVGRGGGSGSVPSSSPVPSQLLNSSRRHRAQSVPGDTMHRGEESDEVYLELQGGVSRGPGTGPSSTGFNPSAGVSASFSNNLSNVQISSPSSSLGNAGGSSNLGVLSMPSRPPIGMSRCGSADRHQQPQGPSALASIGSLSSVSGLNSSSGAGAMPVITCGGVGTLPPMRHSISGNPGIGLPKRDLPSLTLGCSGGSLDPPVLGLPSPVRLSVSGGLSDGASASMPFPDLPPTMAAFDGSAPPSSPRNGVPAVLAPLRVSGALAVSSGAAIVPGSSSSLSAIGSGAVAENAAGGWCGTATGSSGLLASCGSRRHTSPAGLCDSSGTFPTSSGLSTPGAAEGGVASPLTPNQPPINLCAPPRRSHSLTANKPAFSNRQTADGGGSGSDGGADQGDRDAAAPPVGDKERAFGGVAAGSETNSSTAKGMSGITNDLQRAADALLALHAGAVRKHSSSPSATATTMMPVKAAAAPTVPPAQLTRAQLMVVKDSAPGLHWDLRVALRRVFQMLRQELSAGPEGRQLSSTAQECWATLDNYFEGASELIGVLVDGALATAAVQPPSLLPPTSLPSPRQRQVLTCADNASGGDGSAAVGAISSEGQEAGRFRATHEDLRRQLEEVKARLAKAEARATAAEAATAASGGVRPNAVRSGNGVAAPRPPAGTATAVAPPLERCYGTSPRRGKHALVQSNREDVAASSSSAGGGSGSGGAGSASAATSDAVSAAATTPSSVTRNSESSPQRRFDRLAVLARGASYDELVIEEDDSDSDSSATDDSMDTRRRMLTYHSASFAEWVRGVRRK